MKYAKTILAALALCALPAAAELDNQPWISSPGEIFGCRFGEKIPGGKRIYLQNGFNFVYYTPQSKFRGKYTKYHRLVDEPTRQTIGVECQTPADGKDAAKKEVAEALADLAKLFPKANVKKDRLLVGYGEGGAGWDLAGSSCRTSLIRSTPTSTTRYFPSRRRGMSSSCARSTNI